MVVFFYYNTCLIISKTFSLRQKPCIYNLPVMCFSRKRIWSSTVIIDFLQSFDNQKKTIGNFATYDPLMHCLSYKDYSRSYADHMFINHMISKLPIRFTVLLTYFNFNIFYKKNMHYCYFYIPIDEIKICQKEIILKLLMIF